MQAPTEWWQQCPQWKYSLLSSSGCLLCRVLHFCRVRITKIPWGRFPGSCPLKNHFLKGHKHLNIYTIRKKTPNQAKQNEKVKPNQTKTKTKQKTNKPPKQNPNQNNTHFSYAWRKHEIILNPSLSSHHFKAMERYTLLKHKVLSSCWHKRKLSWKMLLLPLQGHLCPSGLSRLDWEQT